MTLTDFNVCFHISDPTSLTSTPTDQTVKEGDETTLYCAAAGNPVPNITWIKDGKTVATGNELRFQANRNQSGKYWCSANNGLGLTVNASAYLNVQCKLEIIIFDVNKIYIWTETRSYWQHNRWIVLIFRDHQHGLHKLSFFRKG